MYGFMGYYIIWFSLRILIYMVSWVIYELVFFEKFNLNGLMCYDMIWLFFKKSNLYGYMG